MSQGGTNDDLINLKENMRFIQDLLEVFLKTTRRERLRRLVENADKLSKYEREQFLSLHELIPVEKLSRH
jgi:hypothetical protein